MSQTVDSRIRTQNEGIITHTSTLRLKDNKIDFGDRSVSLDDVTDIQVIEKETVDYASIVIILLNTLSGILLAYLSATNPITMSVVVGLSALLGYIVVKITYSEPYRYVSIETDDAAYHFGVADPISLANLFATVYKHLDKDLTYEDFNSESTDALKTASKRKSTN